MHIQQLLCHAGIRFQKFPYGPAPGVFQTAGNQLVGSQADLERFQAANRDYLRWRVEPVVTPSDLPGRVPRDQQLCVLVPQRARIQRLPRRGYADLYAFLGNYCGGGAARIRQELLALVGATLRLAGIPG